MSSAHFETLSPARPLSGSLFAAAAVALAGLLAGGCGHKVTAPVHDQVDFSDAADLFTSPIKRTGTAAYDPNQVIAVVDGRPVGRALFEQEVRLRILNLRQRAEPEEIDQHMPEIQQRALQDLVVQALLMGAVEKEQVQITPAEIDAALESVKQALPEGTDWDTYLVANQASEAAIRSRLEARLEMEKLLRSRTANIAAPSEADIQAVYTENQAKFVAPPTASFRHLLLKVPPDADEAAWTTATRKAEKLREFITQKNIPLATLAERYSEDEQTKADGGLIENMPATQLPPALRAAVFESEPGTVGAPVRSAVGVHLVMPESIQPERPLPLEEVREFIVGQLRGGAQQRALEAYVKTLLDAADIEYLAPDRPATAAPAE